MTQQDFDTHLENLRARIRVLPNSRQAPLWNLLDDSRKRDQSVREAIQAARSALDDLRILQKYIAFDQEATMREVRQSLRS